MSFSVAISGLTTFSHALDATGNNIANSDTPGFKSQSLLFADRMAEVISGSVSIGTGVSINGKDINFSQGGIDGTSDPLNLAIQGDGFFRVNQNGNIFFSRAGIFSIEIADQATDNTITDPSGNELTGYPIDKVTSKPSGTIGVIHIDRSNMPPKSTDSSMINTNLNSDSAVPKSNFSITDPTSYNYSNNLIVYDSLGSQHTFQAYYCITTKANTGNTWTVYGTLDGALLANNKGVVGTLQYTNTGQPDSVTPFKISSVVTTGATSPLLFTLDLSNSTQFAIPSNTNTITQNGNSAGTLSTFLVNEKGLIVGKYDNGETVPLAQVALANFANKQALKNIGNNLWLDTAGSGVANTGIPGVGSLGNIHPQAIEKSNVNITQQLVDLIIYQRGYQANVQTIKAADQIQQATIQIR